MFVDVLAPKLFSDLHLLSVFEACCFADEIQGLPDTESCGGLPDSIGFGRTDSHMIGRIELRIKPSIYDILIFRIMWLEEDILTRLE